MRRAPDLRVRGWKLGAARWLAAGTLAASLYAQRAEQADAVKTASELQKKGISGPHTVLEVEDKLNPVTSPKYTEPLRNTPQTIMVIPKQVMEEQGATTLRDVLRNVPGLTVAAGEGGAPAGDNLTLRGFSARNDIFIDGVRDLGPQSRDPFNMEQVEVTKGPSPAFNGRGSTGGSINLVSKAPSLAAAIGGTVQFGTDRTRRFAGDLNVPLQRIGLGERTALRMNVLSHHAGVAGRDAVYGSRWGLAPSLAFGLGRPTRLTFSYYTLQQDNLPDYGIPWVTATHNVLRDYRDQPAPVPRDTYYGLRSRDIEKMGSHTATVKLEHDFSDTVQFRNQLRYGHSSRDSITTAPRFAGNDSLVINRNGPSWITQDNIADNQTDLRARFRTGKLEHAVVTGGNLTRERNVRESRTVAGAPTTTLFSPNPNDPFRGTITLTPNTGDVTGNSQAGYLFDTVKFGQKWEASGGLRIERFAVKGVSTALLPLERTDTMNSLRGALTYKPARSGSVYLSYGTSLNPSLEGLNYQPANTSIEPEKTYTVEAGTKWEVAGGRLLLAGALFRIDKQNARTPGVLPDDPPQVLAGTQRANGAEVSATGSIASKLRLFAAYTYIDGKIVRSNTAAEVGKYFQNTPKNSLSVWASSSVKKLSLGVGPRFVDRRYGNNTNTRSVAGYWTLDALASYALAAKVDLRLNLYNLNNAFYFDRLGGGHLIPGASRSASVAMGFRF
ncbi:MAG: TonB-dependent siderophore receptor [Bryobacterales bacterium]|nr:TonB-dependent siderophore receptor [Bryobacterales bacterium]